MSEVNDTGRNAGGTDAERIAAALAQSGVDRIIVAVPTRAPARTWRQARVEKRIVDESSDSETPL